MEGECDCCGRIVASRFLLAGWWVCAPCKQEDDKTSVEYSMDQEALIWPDGYPGGDDDPRITRIWAGKGGGKS